MLYLPRYIWRKKITIASLKEKLGAIPFKFRGSIWIQVVSVGEANLIEDLVRKLNQLYDYPIVISTTTLTGNRVAKKKYSSLAKVIFLPLDITAVLLKVLKNLQPKVFVAVETELWPNLFWCLKRKNIPIVVINGRISDKAFNRYKHIKPLMRKIFDKCDFVGVQNNLYKERFNYLGCQLDKISITGNMKFKAIKLDPVHLSQLRIKYANILDREKSITIIGGSTHNPEEETLIKTYKDLIDSNLDVSLVLAPRHIERITHIEKMVASNGLVSIRRSQIDAYKGKERCILLIDTIGELAYFYSISDLCFVGGSLIPHGGQNILEPISLLKPTCFGPFMNNFKDIEEIVMEKDAAIKVAGPEELKDVLFELVKDEAMRNKLRLNCLKVFEEEKASLEENLELIVRCLK